MCGFVARLGREADRDPWEVEKAAGELRHRGPDDFGSAALGRATLAHRRLSIVDLDGGRQPLRSEDGRLALVCNGEIYNHAALRARLQGRHRFATRSDSEVILHLYEELGTELVHELDGMFAFVLTDGDRVIAARDPLGIKPLYLGRDRDGDTWTCSTILPLLPHCPFIEEVPPGSLYDSRSGVTRWFQPSWRSTTPGVLEVTPQALLERLDAAVRKRLMSDVPVGVFLSGGLDSSLIAALMRRHVECLHSFAVGLEGSPDLAAARTVARHLGTIHHERVYTVEDVERALDLVVRHLESYDTALLRSAIPCYFVSELAAQHVTVVLSGEGSDEAFAGYRHFASIGDSAALHHEAATLLDGLHNMNLQRVDRMTMAHGLEGRVPFLDIDFLDLAMAVDPKEKLIRPGRPEKWLLRRAATDLLPERIVWRSKQEFAQGCGFETVMHEWARDKVTARELAAAPTRFPRDPPRTGEAYLYRRTFERHFPGPAAQRLVARWRGFTAAEETN